MAFARGPQIAKQGMDLYLDVTNKRSLGGEPTVNYVPNPTFKDGTKSPWSYQQTDNGNINVVSDVFKSDGYSVRIERTTTSGETNTYYDIGPAQNLKPSTQYTFSADILCNTPNTAALLTYKGDVNGMSPKHTGSGKWERISMTVTTSATSQLQIRFGLYDSNVLTYAYFDNIQLEEKPYATTFVDGTRDMWVDLSKNGNDCQMRIYPTMNTNPKSLFYDGLNNHSRIINGVADFNHSWSPDGVAGNSNFTYEIWVKTTDTKGCIISKPWNGSGQYNIKILPNSFSLLAGSTTNSINFPPISNSGNWVQLVCWVDSTSMGYYINGGEYSDSKTHNITGNIPSSGNGNVSLSIMTLYPYGTSWSGNTDHAVEGELGLIRRYSKVLSGEQILQNFNATKSRFGL
jgi:hypothetical protein